MKRALLAMVVALGVGMMGCATSVDDPLPPAPEPQVEHKVEYIAPDETLSAPLRDPRQEIEPASKTNIEISEHLKLAPKAPIPPVPVER